MITLKREDSITLRFHGADVVVTYKIPTAVEAESLEGDLKNYELVRKFGKEVVSDIEGVDSIEALINAPGSAKLIESVAREIIKATFWRDAEEKESAGAVLASV